MVLGSNKSTKISSVTGGWTDFFKDRRIENDQVKRREFYFHKKEGNHLSQVRKDSKENDIGVCLAGLEESSINIAWSYLAIKRWSLFVPRGGRGEDSLM